MEEGCKSFASVKFRTLWSIVLPLSRPLIAVLLVMTFMYRWNEFAWPLVALRDPALYTLPVGLSFLQGQYTTDYPALMAGALVSILPVLVLFGIAQRQFIAGILLFIAVWIGIAKLVVPRFEATYAERAALIAGGIEKAELSSRSAARAETRAPAGSPKSTWRISSQTWW